MKKLTLVALLALLANTGVAMAQTAAHGGAHEHQMAAAEELRYYGVGVFNAVKANKVKITHEPIAELKWPAMTMWFGLRVALPAGMRSGDKVRFELVQTESNQWVVVSIERM